MSSKIKVARKTDKKLRIGILASGEGTNFQAIIDAIEEGRLEAKIAVFISNEPGAKALKRAKEAKIPEVIVDHRNFETRQQHSKALTECLKQYQVDLVVLAGFMRLLDPCLLDEFPQRVINIHPALLPAYPGLNAIEKAYRDGCKKTGVTVHLVDSGVDTGPIIAQSSVAIRSGEALKDLEERIHLEEHRLYPSVIQLFAQGRIAFQDGRVRILEHD